MLLTVASWLSRLVIMSRMTPLAKLICNRPPATLGCRGAWHAASQPSARPGAGESRRLCPHRALCEAAVRRRRGDRETSAVISRPRRRNRRNRFVLSLLRILPGHGETGENLEKAGARTCASKLVGESRRSGAFRGGRASERRKSETAMEWGGVKVTGAAAEQSRHGFCFHPERFSCLRQRERESSHVGSSRHQTSHSQDTLQGHMLQVTCWQLKDSNMQWGIPTTVANGEQGTVVPAPAFSLGGVGVFSPMTPCHWLCLVTQAPDLEQHEAGAMLFQEGDKFLFENTDEHGWMLRVEYLNTASTSQQVQRQVPSP